ncbi:hypothetical protein [Flaviaesturariibacter amylovorans]
MKTKVEMAEVICHLRNMPLPNEVKRATYVIFRIESANGTKGINNNYGGVQADSGRWGAEYDHLFEGTVALKENTTQKDRLFLAFKDTASFLGFLSHRLQARGLYVGGTTWKITKLRVKTVEDLALAYYREWVTGNAKAAVPEANKATITSMYKQASELFK